MKKGIVLILTLFFITLLSILVLKNLDDTDKFFKRQNFVQDNTKLLIATKNMQEQISKLLQENKDRLDEVFDNDEISNPTALIFGDIEISFTIKKYDRVNINNIVKDDDNTVENLFLDNSIYDYDLFFEIYKEKLQITDTKQPNNNQVESYRQIEDIIDTFILRSEDGKIEEIKNELGFEESSDLYELIVLAKNQNFQTRSYYILKNDGGVVYFETSFK